MNGTLSAPILVAVGPQAQALRLLFAAFWAAREQGRPWVAVHVEVEGEASQEANDQARLWLEEAQSLGASVLWIRSRTLFSGLGDAIRRTGAAELLVGRTPGHWPWRRLGPSVSQELVRRLPGVRVRPVILEESAGRVAMLPPPGRRLGALFAGLGVMGACSGLSAILPPEMPAPAIFLLFLAGTAVLARHWGLLTGGLGVLAAGCLLPWLLPGIEAPLVALFLVVLGGGQLAVLLSMRLELEIRHAQRRAALQAALMLLGRNLGRCTTATEVASELATLAGRLLHRPVDLLVPEPEGPWRVLPENTLLPGGPWAEGPSPPLMDVWHREGYLYLPLGQPGACEGALRLPAAQGDDLDPAGRQLLQGFAVQVALALDRLHWLDTAQKSRLAGEAERMRNILLSAISHDLRTPLAGIEGAASSLLLQGDVLPAETRRDLLAMIQGESQRLARLLTDLLHLTRLESGAIQAEREWHPLEELVGAALRQAGDLEVRLDLPEDLPLVWVDGVLLEQLLVNLLMNARRHAPGSPVALSARMGAEGLDLVVSDQGPGVPEALRTHIFEKFFRRPGTREDGGVGLGLAICDAIVKTHGGQIWVEDAPEGGACFRVRLPQGGTPPELPEEVL